MTTDCVIRPARAEDIEAVTAIYGAAVAHGTASYELDPPDLHEMSRRWREIVGGGYPYAVAERDSVVLGYAYASAFRTRPAYRYLVEDSVYVAAHAQRLGLGARLVQRLIDDCEVRGFRQMLAVIGDGSGAGGRASVRLHEALGFDTVGTMRATGYKFGRWLDTIVMQRTLGEGANTRPQPRAHGANP